MTLGAVRAPDPSRHPLAQEGSRSRWELTDVREPRHPGVPLDRVVVCPSGVHVVTVVPSADEGGRDAVLVVAGRTAADVVASLLPGRYRDRVRPVLCVTAAAPVADLVDGVLVTTAETLEHIMRSSPVVLSTSEAHDAALRLAAGLVAAPRPVSGPDSSRTRRTRLLVGLAAAAVAVAALVERAAALPPW